MSGRRLKSPDDLIARLQFKSAGVADLRQAEELYKAALIRYLRGKGIVRHALLPEASLTDSERAVAPDDPCARSLMFLLTVTGTVQLPKDEGKVQVCWFILLFAM